MFRPSRSSSGPSRTQIQALFSFPALWDPKCLQVSVSGAKDKNTYNLLNMFRALICPSSGARDYTCVIAAYSV
jgi:hypothetical protein